MWTLVVGPNNIHSNLSTTETVFSGEKPNKNVDTSKDVDTSGGTQ